MKLSFTCIALVIILKVHGQPQVPVDPFTGKAQVAIPIWTLKTNSIEAPIVLSNTGGGMKVTEGEGNAGIGWNVIAGGSVSREVRGLPDDLEDIGDDKIGWLFGTNSQNIQGFVPQGDNNLVVCTDEANDWGFLWSNLKFYSHDTEPDMFSFSAPGISGQFFFDGNKVLRLAPYQDLKIEYTSDAQKNINAFTITRNDGVKYIFDIRELTTRKQIPYHDWFNMIENVYASSVNFFSAWKLRTIVTPENKSISYTYLGNGYAESKEYKRFIRPGTSIVDTLYVKTDLVNTQVLQTASDPTVNISFTWFNNLLNGITLGNGKKRFSFSYEQIHHSSDLSSAFVGKKYFLNEFKEVGEDCFPFPSYKFEYYDIDFTSKSTSIPIKNGFAQDLWGFYNGQADISTNLIPTLYWKDAAEGAERQRIFPHPSDPGYTTIAGANRAVNPATVYYGSLKRIYYPPGGYAQLTYERADYYDSLVNTTYMGGGVRVTEVRMSDGDADVSNDIVTTYQYKRTDNHSSGKFLYPAQFGWIRISNGLIVSPDNLSPNDDLLYSRVTVKQAGIGSTIYQYSIPGTYQQLASGDWGAPYTSIARDNGSTNCAVYAPFKKGYFIYPFAPSTNYGFERGLISKISKYNEANELVQESSFQYARIGPGAGYTKALKAKDVGGGFVYTSYKLIANITKLTIIKTEKVYDPSALTNSISTISNYTYDPSSYLLRSNTITNSDGSIQKTRYKYAKDFTAITNPSGAFAQAVKLLNTSNRHGVVLESIQSNTRSGSTELITGSELTLYNQYSNAGGLILPSEKQIFAGTTGFAESYIFLNGALQEIRSGGYRSVSFIDEYDNTGNILTQRDGQRNVQSALYTPVSKNGIGGFYPIPRAAISNARYDEVVHNLFDFVDITVSGNPVTSQTYVGGAATPHHTGQLAMTLAIATTLSKDNVKKSNSKYYRFTARVRAAAAVNLTVRALNGAVIKASAVVPILATGGAWKFVEAQLDMSTVTSPFRLELANSAPIDYDEIAFYPFNADISSSTFDIVHGKLTETSSRGVSSFMEYDKSGRLKYVRDQDKNILQISEYQYKSKPSSPLVARYNISSAFSIGQVINFVALPNCLPNTTYTWYVNGTQASTGFNLTFSYTFTANDPVVKLVVALGQESVSYESGFHYTIPPVYTPPPPTCTPTISIAITGSTTLYSCALESFARTFTATLTNTSGCTGVALSWQIRRALDNDWVTVSGASTYNFSFESISSNPQSLSVRCLAQYSTITLAESPPIGLTYVDQGTCR